MQTRDRVILGLVSTWGADAKKVVNEYKIAFPDGINNVVLQDLRANASVNTPLRNLDGAIDTNEILLKEGKRELYIYMANVLSLTEEDIEKALNG